MKSPRIPVVALALACFGILQASAQTLVFTNMFDDPLPSEIQPGVATNTPVQLFAGLGPAGNKFGGSFLRSPTGNLVTLTLTNLPPHKFLSMSMLFAAIDSLDGTGSFPSGDFFRVSLGSDSQNGTVVFRESFANATQSQVQSYVAPEGGELARHVDLGFNGPGSYYTDSAYNFDLDTRFKDIPHTASVAVISFQMEGPGVQSLDDESWAIDNLGISVADESAAAPPVITRIVPENQGVILTWTTASNRVYQVQSCTNIVNPDWVDLSPVLTATNLSSEYSAPVPAGNKFYRVKMLGL